MTFRAGRRAAPRRRLRLPRVVHGRPLPRRGPRPARRSSARCGSGTASTRSAAPRGPGSARSRARSRSTTSARSAAARGGSSSRRRPERVDARFGEGLSPDLEAALARLTRRRARGRRAPHPARPRRRRRLARARHLRDQLHDPSEPRAQEARGGPPCRSVTSSPSCGRRASSCPASCASAFARSPPRRRPPARRFLAARRSLVLLVPARRRARRRARDHTAERRTRARPASPARRAGIAGRAAPSAAVPAPSAKAFAPAPSPTRVQRYGATIALQVAVAERPSRTPRSARSRSPPHSAGYPTSVHASSADKTGVADLVLRIPRRHVQEAVTRLSQLGTITASRSTSRTSRPASMRPRGDRAAAATAGDAPREPQTPERDRAIAAITAQVERLQRAEAATVRSAQLATFRLHVATPPAVQPAHHGHGPLHGIGTPRSLDGDRRASSARLRHPAARSCIADLAGRPDAPAQARGRAAQPAVSWAKTRNVGLPTGSSENSGFTQPSSSKRDS